MKQETYDVSSINHLLFTRIQWEDAGQADTGGGGVVEGNRALRWGPRLVCWGHVMLWMSWA